MQAAAHTTTAAPSSTGLPRPTDVPPARVQVQRQRREGDSHRDQLSVPAGEPHDAGEHRDDAGCGGHQPHGLHGADVGGPAGTHAAKVAVPPRIPRGCGRGQSTRQRHRAPVAPRRRPVSDANLDLLLSRLGPVERVLDLGCGFGEWLHAALEATPQASGVGVDTSRPALEQARRRARDRGLEARVAFEETEAASYEGAGFDAVLCIGATHAFGGLAGTLQAVRRYLRR